MIAYFNGKFLPIEEIKISPFDRGFQFSDGVYEVIRYYPKKFFELGAHINRLHYSLSQINISISGLETIQETLNSLIEQNGLTNSLAIAYIQITRGVQFPRRHLYDKQLTPTVFMYIEAFPQNITAQTKGVTAGLEEDLRWQRCDIKSISLLPGILAKQRAAANGYYEILLHRNRVVTEGTHTNVGFVKNGIFITPPLNNFILAGVTRKIVLEICGELGIKSEERECSIDELVNADEVFIMGTTTEVTPIIKINNMNIGAGNPGKITSAIQKELRKRF